MRHRVVLVRERDARAAGSGCCGGFDGLRDEPVAPGAHARIRVDMEAMGAVYRALRDRWSADEVEIVVVEPRNMVWLVPAVWRDARRRGGTRRQAWRQVLGVAHNTVIVDGEVVFTATPPHPAEAVAVVGAALAGQ